MRRGSGSVGVGLSTGSVGAIIARSTLLGIAGGACAALVARRGRERVWTMIGVAAFGVATAAIAMSAAPKLFVVVMCVQAFLFVFTGPFITAVASHQDRTGGLAVAASGWSNLVGSGAPALAGVLISSGEFANLAWLALGATVHSVAAWARVGRTRALRSRPRGGW